MRAKDKMQRLGIEYMDINLDNYPERRSEAKQRSGKNTVPQIFFNNRHVGGFDDFDKLVRECLGIYAEAIGRARVFLTFVFQNVFSFQYHLFKPQVQACPQQGKILSTLKFLVCNPLQST